MDMKKRHDIMIFMCGVMFAAACCLSGSRLAAERAAGPATASVIPETNHGGADPEIPNDPDVLNDWEILQMAIMKTESGFDPSVVGTSNDRGVMQITPIYVREVNRLLGENRYTHDDAFSVTKSIEMFNIMQSRKNPHNDMSRAVRGHNPGGSANGYSKKVKDNIEFIKRMEAARAEIIRMRSDNI